MICLFIFFLVYKYTFYCDMSGKFITNSVPFPTCERQMMSPPALLTIFSVIDSPIPRPEFLVVKFGEKIFLRTSSGIPLPLSFMETKACVSSMKRDMSILSGVSCRVASMAFLTIFDRICTIDVASSGTMTGYSGRVDDMFLPVYSPTTFLMTLLKSQRPLRASRCEDENSANEVAICERVSICDSSMSHSREVLLVASGDEASKVI